MLSVENEPEILGKINLTSADPIVSAKQFKSVSLNTCNGVLNAIARN